jgi:soluble lytic murein transglycosylase-like protein
MAGVTDTDFVRVVQGILGGPFEGQALVDLPCDAAVRSRDQVAWSMSLAGYSTRDIGDVLAGRTTAADLDEARFRLMAGQPRQAVSAFLDARRQVLLASPAVMLPARPVDGLAVVRPPAPFPAGTPGSLLDAELRALARLHRVSPDLVRAVIAAESNWNARAVSEAGAIGLMQLMPATAASLGVDPWHPVDNLRGGITYLGSLLRSYRENARLALIAYHAGPTHANRVRDGRATTYSTTRQYLNAIAQHYPLR